MASTTPLMHVCMDTSDWLKGIVDRDSVSQDNSSTYSPIATDLLSYAKPSQPLLERRLRPPHDHPLKCPRCDSTHTKFCYYNNYSLSQPRYFCKTCRRYWTKGGSLRNVPVGGGCRRNKRSSAVKKPSELQPTMSNCTSVHHQPLIDLQLFSSCETGIGESSYNGMMMNPLGFSIVEEMNEVEAKPGNRMISLEWPEQGCGDMYGCGALWTGMMNGNGHGHGPSSAAM